MAQRPIFVPDFEGDLLVRTIPVPFDWFPGLSLGQKQRSIESLHASARQLPGIARILEISTKSPVRIGVALSAFNLTLKVPAYATPISVESAFQGSKVFEHGGPYTDIHAMTARDAKGDARLRNSGRLLGFRFLGVDWPLEPATAFYDNLYISALLQNVELGDRVAEYSAFTDIEFNPERSVNCQAYSVALYASLRRRGLLAPDRLDQTAFLDLVGKRPISSIRENGAVQPGLF